MALVIEDGTLVAGANSFSTRDEWIAYAATRGVTIPDADAQDKNLILAMDYLWSICLKGELVDDDQTTPFPRKGLVEGDTADDWVYTIPQRMKNAQMQLGLDVFNGIDLTPSGGASEQLKRSKIGPIEEEFFERTADDLALDLVVANAWLAPYLCAVGFSLTTIRV